MPMSDNDDSGRSDAGFKVVDRRRFSADGETINPGLATNPGMASAVNSGAAPIQRSSMDTDQKDTRVGTSPTAHESHYAGTGHEYAPVNFSGFLVGLAHQAMVMLGEVPDPGTGQVVSDFGAARETIDLLGLLEEKTKGNLTAEESRLLSEVLATLRIQFVQRTTGR